MNYFHSTGLQSLFGEALENSFSTLNEWLLFIPVESIVGSRVAKLILGHPNCGIY